MFSFMNDSFVFINSVNIAIDIFKSFQNKSLEVYWCAVLDYDKQTTIATLLANNEKDTI